MARSHRPASESSETIPCACGCGVPIAATDLRGRPKSHAAGHSTKGNPHLWSARPASRNWRTSRGRAARKLGDRKTCDLVAIGGCRGSLETHHKDKDPTNNADENLMKVCRSHHRLLDRGKIDPAAPVMPPFYVDGSGKRRYL